MMRAVWPARPGRVRIILTHRRALLMEGRTGQNRGHALAGRTFYSIQDGTGTIRYDIAQHSKRREGCGI